MHVDDACSRTEHTHHFPDSGHSICHEQQQNMMFSTPTHLYAPLLMLPADVLQLARETTHIVQSYTLPDGRVIKVGAERFMAAEIMFRPELIDMEMPGISENVFSCIQASCALPRQMLVKTYWL